MTDERIHFVTTEGTIDRDDERAAVAAACEDAPASQIIETDRRWRISKKPLAIIYDWIVAASR